MPLIRRAEGSTSSDEWLIREGISFVFGFDHDHSALAMTLRPEDAKRFGSQREAELWIEQYGKDLTAYRIDKAEGVRERGQAL